MYTEFVLVFILSLLLEICLQRRWITKMRAMKIEQVTKLYGPAWHEELKTGTPTMGGAVFPFVFVVSAAAGVFLTPFSDIHVIAKIAAYPLLAAAVGFADDWLKYARHSSDGLKSVQKLVLQVLITVPWALWITNDTLWLLPSIALPRCPAILLLIFAGVGLQNAVNVTDGLDGLASGSVLISLLGALSFLGGDPSVVICIGAAAGICMGFLWHNSFPASVFMGDVGAHFFAGLLLSLCVVSGAFLFVIPISFIFGAEILSVALQILSIRGFGKKVFLMSPIHHHFEMLGWRETVIVARFWIVHAAGMLVVMMLIFLLLSGL